MQGTYKIVLVRADPNYGAPRPKGISASHLLKSCLLHYPPICHSIKVDVVELNSCWRNGLDCNVAWIMEREPSLIGFSCYCWNVEMAASMAAEIKRLQPEVPIVAGGPEVSFNAHNFLLAHRAFDFVVRGEGEQTLCELVDRLIGNGKKVSDILGLSYRHEGTILHNPDRPLIADLDTIPSPLLDGTVDLWQTDGEVAFETMRGCYYQCTYCLHTKGMAGVRSFSWARIEAELKLLCEHPAIDVIWFTDPTFNAEETRALRICELVTRFNKHQGVAFELRAELLSQRLIEQLGKLQVVDVGIGLQSTNAETLKRIRRPADLRKVSENISKLHKVFHGKPTRVDLDVIYGLPGDAYKDYLKTVEFALGLKGNVYYQPLRVFKGAAIAEQVAQLGLSCLSIPPYNILASQTFPRSDMVKAYQLNAGIDFYQCGVPAIKDSMDSLAECAASSVGKIAQKLGSFLWEKKMKCYFRVSNASPSDLPVSWRIRDMLAFLESERKETYVTALSHSREKLARLASNQNEKVEYSGYYHAAI